VAIDAASSDRGSKPRRTHARLGGLIRAPRAGERKPAAATRSLVGKGEQRRRHLDRPRRLQVDDGAQRACVFNGSPTQTILTAIRRAETAFPATVQIMAVPAGAR
jgi:hypothetical protein